MSVKMSSQLRLDLPIREKREVNWIVATQETKKRFMGMGKKVVMNVIGDEDLGGIKEHVINSDDIPKVKDQQLAAALRLEDAANAMGWIPDGVGFSHHHDVTIYATDEGFDSKLIAAHYSGRDDSLMDDLRSFAPKHEDN